MSKKPIDALVHIADLHFWQIVKNPVRLMNKRFLGNLNVMLRRRHKFPLDQAEPFADVAAAAGPKHVLLTGDFTSTSTHEEFAMAAAFVRGLRDRGLDIHVVPGNHDVYTFRSARKKRFEHHFGDFLPTEGYPSVQTLPGGTPIILVPTACPNIISSAGRVTLKTIEVLRRLLHTCGDQVIVAAHYPLLSHTYGYVSSSSHLLRNAKALRRVLGTSGRRILYVCGHVHHFSLVRDPRFEDVLHLSTGAFFERPARSDPRGEFAEIEVCDDGFKVFQHRFREQWKRKPAVPHDAEPESD